MIFEFDFLVAYFQFLQIMLSSLLLTHCLMIGDMFSEILINGYNYVVQVTWSTYIDKHSRLNINDSGEVREGEGVEGMRKEQASSYRLTIRVHNDLQRTNRRLQIHTGRAVVLNNCYEIKYKLNPICTKQTTKVSKITLRFWLLLSVLSETSFRITLRWQVT